MESRDLSDTQLRDNLRVLDRIHRRLGTFGSIARLSSEIAADCENPLRILDVGAGSGALGSYLNANLKTPVKYVRLEPNHSIFTAVENAIATDCRARIPGLPFADESFDLVTSTLLLHHLGSETVSEALRDTYRVARHAVMHHDLRRSRGAYWGTWFVLRLVTTNPIARHDGPLSVLRSHTIDEWESLLGSEQLPYEVHRRWPWRVELTARKTSG